MKSFFQKSVIYFSYSCQSSQKWQRSCRKPHFKNDTWFMRRHLQIWLLKHHHHGALEQLLRSSSGQFTLLLPSSQMLSSFLHHWLETWLCLILANEGTNEGRGHHDTICTVVENHKNVSFCNIASGASYVKSALLRMSAVCLYLCTM